MRDGYSPFEKILRAENEPEGLCEMANDGIMSGKYDAVHFDLFNGQELLQVRKIMAKKYPHIKYGWSVVTLGDIEGGGMTWRNTSRPAHRST